jgi:hypothetical protein
VELLKLLSDQAAFVDYAVVMRATALGFMTFARRVRTLEPAA